MVACGLTGGYFVIFPSEGHFALYTALQRKKRKNEMVRFQGEAVGGV